MIFNIAFSIYLGYLEKTNVPNISSVGSITYDGNTMKMFKASNISDGVSIPYKILKVYNTIRVTSLVTSTMNVQSSRVILKR